MGKFGLKKVLLNEKGFFFLKFGEEGAYRHLSEIGAWNFFGKLMVLQEWYADMDYEKEGLTRWPLWIQHHNVPLQYWNEEGLSYIASAVGKPLYADEMTESTSRISFAKICMEVNDTSALLHSVEVLTASGKVVTVRIKYPWRPTKCVSCKVFGHNECNKKTVAWLRLILIRLLGKLLLLLLIRFRL